MEEIFIDVQAGEDVQRAEQAGNEANMANEQRAEHAGNEANMANEQRAEHAGNEANMANEQRAEHAGNEANTASDPEKKITLFALHLALMERAASLLSTICFIWATVVLLGGFASTLKFRDFWFVTIIILIEATRVFGRSNELELQENPVLVYIPIDARATRREVEETGTATPTETTLPPQNTAPHHSDIPLVPFGGSVFASRNIRHFLYWIQVISAVACVVLSIIGLALQNFGSINGTEQSALVIFYSLALAEGLIFLLERLYKEWKFNRDKLISTVSNELNLGEVGEESIRRFFYRAYSKSISGSILESIKMDIISFAQELLASDSHEEQLIAVHLLRNFVTNKDFSDKNLRDREILFKKKKKEALRKIATSTTVVERLIEMLNWKNPAKEQIRYMAAEIVLKLTGKRQNVLRIARIPGSVESISSLLDKSANNDNTVDDNPDYRSLIFNEMGLRIIRKLANDRANAGIICNTRGLLSRIIYLTKGKSKFLQTTSENHIGIRIVLCSLKVVRRLVGTVGHTGKKLRTEISDNIFILTYLQKLLDNGKDHPKLQTIAIEILMDLAQDETAKEKIGITGGIIPQLLCMFTDPSFSVDVRSKAGDGLAFIAIQSEENCLRIVKEDMVEKLVDVLEDSRLQLSSSRVLLSLCTYTKRQHRPSLRAAISALPSVIMTLMTENENRLLEVSIGLAAQIIKHANQGEYEQTMELTNVAEEKIAERLVEIIKNFRSAKVEVPRMRRFIIELSIAMMNKNTNNIQTFDMLGMENVLRHVQRSISELETFTIFSGSIGLSPHRLRLSFLVDNALGLIRISRNHAV